MKVLIDREDLVFNPPELGCVLSLSGLPGGGSKIYDRSPYGNISAITGAAWVRLPSGLWYLSFDGTDDYVDCGAGAGLDVTGAFTLEAWLNTEDKTLEGQQVINKDSIAANGRAYVLQLSSGRPYVFVFSEKNSTNYLNFDYGTQLEDDTWYHVVATWDGGPDPANIKIYVNSVSAGSGAETGTFVALQTVAEPLLIGARKSVTPERFFKGDIALPRIYNRALSAAEVQHHFNQEKHLFGVWSFTVA